MLNLLRRLQRDEGGQGMLFAVFVLLIGAMVFMLSLNVGGLVSQKIRMQNAADAAAFSGAIVQARLLNLIAVLNDALIVCLVVKVVAMVLKIAFSFIFWVPPTCEVIYRLMGRAQKALSKVMGVIRDASPFLVQAEVIRIARANQLTAGLAIPHPKTWSIGPQLNVEFISGATVAQKILDEVKEKVQDNIQTQLKLLKGNLKDKISGFQKLLEDQKKKSIKSFSALAEEYKLDEADINNLLGVDLQDLKSGLDGQLFDEKKLKEKYGNINDLMNKVDLSRIERLKEDLQKGQEQLSQSGLSQLSNAKGLLPDDAKAVQVDINMDGTIKDGMVQAARRMLFIVNNGDTLTPREVKRWRLNYRMRRANYDEVYRVGTEAGKDIRITDGYEFSNWSDWEEKTVILNSADYPELMGLHEFSNDSQYRQNRIDEWRFLSELHRDSFYEDGQHYWEKKYLTDRVRKKRNAYYLNAERRVSGQNYFKAFINYNETEEKQNYYSKKIGNGLKTDYEPIGQAVPENYVIDQVHINDAMPLDESVFGGEVYQLSEYDPLGQVPEIKLDQSRLDTLLPNLDGSFQLDQMNFKIEDLIEIPDPSDPLKITGYQIPNVNEVIDLKKFPAVYDSRGNLSGFVNQVNQGESVFNLQDLKKLTSTYSPQGERFEVFVDPISGKFLKVKFDSLVAQMEVKKTYEEWMNKINEGVGSTKEYLENEKKSLSSKIDNLINSDKIPKSLNLGENIKKINFQSDLFRNNKLAGFLTERQAFLTEKLKLLTDKTKDQIEGTLDSKIDEIKIRLSKLGDGSLERYFVQQQTFLTQKIKLLNERGMDALKGSLETGINGINDKLVKLQQGTLKNDLLKQQSDLIDRINSLGETAESLRLEMGADLKEINLQLDYFKNNQLDAYLTGQKKVWEDKLSLLNTDGVNQWRNSMNEELQEINGQFDKLRNGNLEDYLNMQQGSLLEKINILKVGGIDALRKSFQGELDEIIIQIGHLKNGSLESYFTEKRNQFMENLDQYLDPDSSQLYVSLQMKMKDLSGRLNQLNQGVNKLKDELEDDLNKMVSGLKKYAQPLNDLGKKFQDYQQKFEGAINNFTEKYNVAIKRAEDWTKTGITKLTGKAGEYLSDLDGQIDEQFKKIQERLDQATSRLNEAFPEPMIHLIPKEDKKSWETVAAVVWKNGGRLPAGGSFFSSRKRPLMLATAQARPYFYDEKKQKANFEPSHLEIMFLPQWKAQLQPFTMLEDLGSRISGALSHFAGGGGEGKTNPVFSIVGKISEGGVSILADQILH